MDLSDLRKFSHLPSELMFELAQCSDTAQVMEADDGCPASKFDAGLQRRPFARLNRGPYGWRAESGVVDATAALHNVLSLLEDDLPRQYHPLGQEDFL